LELKQRGLWIGSRTAGAKKQIPFGNDKQEETGNGNSKRRFPAGITNKVGNDKEVGIIDKADAEEVDATIEDAETETGRQVSHHAAWPYSDY
jgi:hypothetical protein